ncbi:glycosyltransferase family 9 protein [Pantoea vagans]|uniref:glycosyltransferase family 9 protein n=1 Tax=Pantoea vagans TaxID=470934 RepID=UPI003207EF57
MKILIICRDNIGDSILATPLIAHLHVVHNAIVDVLTNSYAAPVFNRNPHISSVHKYRKNKHCKGIINIIAAGFFRLKTIFRLRRERYDVMIIVKSVWDPHSVKWAAGIRAKRVIAFGDKAHPLIDTLLPPPKGSLHVAERFFMLSAAVTKASEVTQQRYLPGKSSIFPDPELVKDYRETFNNAAGECIVALQISARKPAQQWSAGNFITLVRLINKHYGCRIFLFWSPGNSNNPMHPGDDLKAEYINAIAAGSRLEVIPTRTLEELKAALSLCTVMVSSDGGAVHIAAALGLPIVALYGNSDPAEWHPWLVPHKTLHGAHDCVNEIQPENVMSALISLLNAE